jgi:hypothetical protein
MYSLITHLQHFIIGQCCKTFSTVVYSCNKSLKLALTAVNIRIDAVGNEAHFATAGNYDRKLFYSIIPKTSV